MAEFILKDWYGKEKTFDKETIYARDVEGNLIPFTQGDGKPTLAALEVTENGTYEAPDGVDGYSPVTVNVPDTPAVLQDKEATENGEYTADEGYDGLSKVTVNVPTPEVVLQDKTITENGTYEADEGYDGLGSVLVNVASSDGPNVVIATGTIDTEQSADYTFEHGLGVVPDFVYVKNASFSSGYLYYAVGISTALAEKISPAIIYNAQNYYYNSKYYIGSNTYGIDTSYGKAIANATEKSVMVQLDSTVKLAAGSTWVAIGGLA